MSHTQFSDYELKTLLDDERNCVKFQKGVKHISLHPFYLNNVAAGIAENLNKFVSKYDKSLNGIILAYKKPRLQQSNGIVHNDKSSIFVDVEAEFYIFCPQENSCVKAIVNKTGQDHIGCLIHKAFNISVPRPRHETDWKGKFVKTGDEILVKITYVDMYYIIPYIKGEIVDILMKSVKSEIDNDSVISTNAHNPKTTKKKSKSNKNKSFTDSNMVEEDAAVNVQLKIDPEKETNKKPRKSKMNSIIPEMIPQISDNLNSENKNETDLTQTTIGKIKSKNRRNTVSEIIPSGDGSLENTNVTINNNFKSKKDKSKNNIEVDASPISSKLKKKEIYNDKLDETNEASERLIKKIKTEKNASPIPDSSKVENPDFNSATKVKSPKKIKNDSLNKISKNVETKLNEKNDETNEVSEKLIKKIKTEKNASPIPDSSKVENPDFNSATKVKSPKKIKNDSLNKISKNVETKLNEKNDETNEVSEKLIKKIKTERNASPIPESSIIDNDSIISTNAHNPKTAKKKSKSNKNKSFTDSNMVEEDAAVNVQLKIDPEKETNKKSRKSKMNSIIPEMIPQISDNLNSENKNETDLTQTTIGKIMNVETKLNEKNDETNEVSEKLIKKIKTERNASPIQESSKVENPDINSEKKVKSPKKIKNDSLNKISQNVETKLNAKNESKLISPITQDDKKSSKKIKNRRQTVSELLPAETLGKEEKKKHKKHNRSLDDNDIVLQKPAIDFIDVSPKKSKKSKKQKSTISEVENDIQALKNKLIQSVLNECSLNKQESSLDQSNSQTSSSKKRKKKHSIETSELNQNSSESTPQKHETLDGSENGLKKPKSKRKKMNSSSEKYPSLQLDTPHYVDYVPTNEVSTFHDSISPIKMKDRPNLSSPETKKYTSPVGERRKSKNKKNPSPTKPSGLLSDFHTDLISKYLNK